MTTTVPLYISPFCKACGALLVSSPSDGPWSYRCSATCASGVHHDYHPATTAFLKLAERATVAP